MPKQIMTRRAADNPYLHKDFHGALSTGIEYLHLNYGEEAVREYLRRFTRAFYAPLITDINARGLIALKEHFEAIYRPEGVEPKITISDDEMVVKVEANPAITHMREHGYAVARLFCETDLTVNQTLCEGTPFAVETIEYDPETGHSVQRFYRRPV